VIALNTSSDSHLPDENGLRPVNLRTDLAPLADLIELVFASSMDESGRLAIQEMRTVSRLGSALGFLGRLNELVLGISLGYVWIEDGRLVGNVSIYPATYPYGGGAGWIIANVGVHPDYQRRGIAYQLMRAALRMIAGKGGEHAILQVDYDNTPAINLYARLGFIMERAFTTWTRSSMMPPPPENNAVFITRRTSREWHQEYELAQHVRPANRGGIGWLRPLHPAMFRTPLWRQIWETVTLSGIERLVVHSPDKRRLLASAWVENPFVSSRTRLTLLADPAESPVYIEAVLGNILRRLRTSSFSIEHPRDDDTVTELLRRHRFLAERAVWHMRYDF
jgi:ribosomal protein S18 acetylase RimI-like enzyme